MEFYCKKCNEKLTKAPLMETKIKGVQLKEECQILESGFYSKNEGLEINFAEEIHYIMNPSDLWFRYHKDGSRLHGCCGPNPFDGLNITCPNCSNEIGVTSEDCWLPHFIGISKNTISTHPLW